MLYFFNKVSNKHSVDRLFLLFPTLRDQSFDAAAVNNRCSQMFLRLSMKSVTRSREVTAVLVKPRKHVCGESQLLSAFFLLYLSSSIWLGVALCVLCRSGSWNSKSLWRMNEHSARLNSRSLLELVKNAVTQMSSSEIIWIRKPPQAGISQKKRNEICYVTGVVYKTPSLSFRRKCRFQLSFDCCERCAFLYLRNAKMNLRCQPV